MSTSRLRLTKSGIESGMTATRFSPGKVSLTTPTIMAFFTLTFRQVADVSAPMIYRPQWWTTVSCNQDARRRPASIFPTTAQAKLCFRVRPRPTSDRLVAGRASRRQGRPTGRQGRHHNTTGVARKSPPARCDMAIPTLYQRMFLALGAAGAVRELVSCLERWVAETASEWSRQK